MVKFNKVLLFHFMVIKKYLKNLKVVDAKTPKMLMLKIAFKLILKVKLRFHLLKSLLIVTV